MRREIAAALERKIRVVPLLVEGAVMPAEEELPEDIADLAEFQAHDIRNKTWDHGVRTIADMIREAQAEKGLVAKPEQPPGREPEPEAETTAGPQPESAAAREEEERRKRAMADMLTMAQAVKMPVAEAEPPIVEPAAEAEAETAAAREAAATATREAEEKAAREAEEKAQREQEAKAKRAAAAKARREAAAKAKQEAAEKAEREAAESSSHRPLSEILDETGLTYRQVGNAFGLLFHAEKAEQVAVAVQDVAHDIVLFSTPSPNPGGSKEESWLHNLLRLSLAADYIKAVARGSDVRLACEIPRAMLTPKVAEGLIRGLAYLADSTADDFTSDAGWRELQLGCAQRQSHFFDIDAEQAKAEVERLAEKKGIRTDSEGGSLRLHLPLAGTETRVVVHTSSTVVSFAAYFSDLKPSGDKVAYMRRMLELSGTVDVARLVLDSDGDAAFFYEVPEVAPDTLDQIEAQFTMLLIGMAVVHVGA